MPSRERAHSSDESRHLSLRDLHDGRWEVLCDRMTEPMISVDSREAAFDFAMLFAVDHPPTTVEMAD